MIIRVCLNGASGNTDRIRFDLIVGQDMKPLLSSVCFGWYGAFTGSDVADGILLKPDGTIDFGCSFEGSGRFHKTNLLAKKIQLGEYVTIWWLWGSEPLEETYVIEAATVLSSITEFVTINHATFSHIETIEGLPKFRARVKRSFNIEGYDGVVYRPPIGVEGDVALFQSFCVFCPDNAVAKNGQLITTTVNTNNLELIIDEHLGERQGQEVLND